MTTSQFSKWLTGFIDGEGSFQVFLDRHYLRVMFRIRLHKDDINVLQKIQEFLGVGRVVLDGNTCVFRISNVKDLINVLFPLLDKYNLGNMPNFGYGGKHLHSLNRSKKNYSTLSTVRYYRTYSSEGISQVSKF